MKEIIKTGQTGIAVASIDLTKANNVSTTIKEAVTSALIPNVPEDDLYNLIVDLVGTAYLHTGFAAPDQVEAGIIIKGIQDYLKREKSNLRVDELQIAFYNGIHEVYGKYYGLSVKTFCDFIRGYLHDPARLQEIKNKHVPAIQSPAEPTKEQLFQWSLDNLLNAYKHLSNNGTVGLYGSPVYDFLNSINLLVLSYDDLQDYNTEAIAVFTQEKEEQIKNQSDKFKRESIRRELEAFMKVTDSKKVTVITKRLIVDDYLRQMILDELDTSGLKDFIIKQYEVFSLKKLHNKTI